MLKTKLHNNQGSEIMPQAVNMIHQTDFNRTLTDNQSYTLIQQYCGFTTSYDTSAFFCIWWDHLPNTF